MAASSRAATADRLTQWLALNLSSVVDSWMAVWAKQTKAEREQRGIVAVIAEGPAETFWVPYAEVVAMCGADSQHVLHQVTTYNPATHMVVCLVETSGAMACAVVAKSV